MSISTLRFLVDHSRAKAFITDIIRNSAELVSKIAHLGLDTLVCVWHSSCSCRYTLGQTVLTETGRDNRSPGILLPSTLFLYASIVGQ